MVVVSAEWAAAGPATVLDYLNLRLGPGYDYPVIEVVPAGWIVDASSCAGGWCHVDVLGIAGFVDANYLGVSPAPVIARGVSSYYWRYGIYDSRYAYWTYPYRDYYGARYDPHYGYYYEYYGAPYVGPFANAYAEAGDTNVAIGRRATDRVGRPAVAKTSATVTVHIATPSSGSLKTAFAVRPNRTGQNPPQ
jgi:hypothetical protein